MDTPIVLTFNPWFFKGIITPQKGRSKTNYLVIRGTGGGVSEPGLDIDIVELGEPM